MALADALAGLGAIGQGYVKTQDELSRMRQREMLANLEALQFQRLNQQFQQQQGSEAIAGKSLQDALAGMPRMQQPSPPPQPTPPQPLIPPQQASGDPNIVKGSWFGNAPGWVDPSDSGLQASGKPVSAGPGIALPSRATLGQEFDVTAPSGQTMRLPQTDIGPAKWTGRGVDINALAAQAFGYTPKNFPTDQNFIVKAADQSIGQAAVGQAQSGIPVPLVKGAADVSRQALPSIDPADYGRSSLQSIVQAVEKNAGSASDVEKFMAVQQLQKLMLPEDQMMMRAYMAQNQQAFRASIAEFTQDQINRRFQTGQEFRAERGGGGDKYAQSKMLEITPPEGGAPYTVLAREGKGQVGWVDSITGQPLQVPPGGTVKEVTASTQGGGRAGAQIQRQLTAGAEVGVDLKNVAKMPVGTTQGFFGGVKQGTSLWNALPSDLATQLTTEDEINMKQSMAGLGRELSTLMSPVYGGNWASEQLEPLIPKAGYTVTNALFGMARIKQSAINALKSLQPSPILNADQKAYARQLEGEINKDIPWDVQDVIDFQQGKAPKESFGEYAKRSGVQGASGGASVPIPGEFSKMTVDQLQPFLTPDAWGKLTPEQQQQIAVRAKQLKGE